MIYFLSSVPHAWVRLGGVGRIFKLLKREGVTDVVMAGTITRPSLLSLMPDFAAMGILFRMGGLGRGDNQRWSAIIERHDAVVVGDLGFELGDNRRIDDELGEADAPNAQLLRQGIEHVVFGARIVVDQRVADQFDTLVFERPLEICFPDLAFFKKEFTEVRVRIGVHSTPLGRS